MQQIQNIPINVLKKHNKNPRTITSQHFEQLKERLKKDPDFFNLRPLLVSQSTDRKTLIIYAGNQRFEAAKALGYTHVPCIVESDIPELLQRERMVADNLHHGDFNFDVLANEFNDIDLSEMGFKDCDYQSIKDTDIDDGQSHTTEEEKKETIKCPKCNHEFSMP